MPPSRRVAPNSLIRTALTDYAKALVECASLETVVTALSGPICRCA